MYQDLIRKELNSMEREDIDPRHVEGYMRLKFGTLDHLSQTEILIETANLIPEIENDLELAEDLAQSYGL